MSDFGLVVEIGSLALISGGVIGWKTASATVTAIPSRITPIPTRLQNGSRCTKL